MPYLSALHKKKTDHKKNSYKLNSDPLDPTESLQSVNHLFFIVVDSGAINMPVACLQIKTMKSNYVKDQSNRIIQTRFVSIRLL